MREIDFLDGKRCGVKGCGRLAQHSRSRIAPILPVERVYLVEVLFCDDHAALADTNPELFKLPCDE